MINKKRAINFPLHRKRVLHKCECYRNCVWYHVVWIVWGNDDCKIYRASRAIGFSRRRITTRTRRSCFWLGIRLINKVAEKYLLNVKLGGKVYDWCVCRGTCDWWGVWGEVRVCLCSAKTAQNVEETFVEIAKNLYYGTKRKTSLSSKLEKGAKDQGKLPAV